GAASSLATGNEVLVPDALRHPPEREALQAAPHIATNVAILKATGEDLIKSRSGNDAQLPQPGHSPRQSPIGYAHPHAALDNLGTSSHAKYNSHTVLR